MQDNTAVRVKPPVEKEDIESSFQVEYEGEQLTINAKHEWSVDPDPTVWSDLTYDEIDQMEWTEWGVKIHREFTYRPRDGDYDEYVACYISKYSDVPDVNGFNDGKKYSHDFPDPWLFEGDQEEFPVKDGVPQEKDIESWCDEDGEYQSEWVYEPLYDSVNSIQDFAHAHHFGLLEPQESDSTDSSQSEGSDFGELKDSPDPVQQVIDVLEWNYPEAITLEEYKDLTSSVTEGATAD